LKVEIKVPKEFFADPADAELYGGVYILKRIKGWKRLQIDKKATKIDFETGQVTFDVQLWNLMILQASLEKPRKTVEDLKEFPPDLLDFLIEKAVDLNSLSAEKRDFLLSASSIKSQR